MAEFSINICSTIITFYIKKYYQINYLEPTNNPTIHSSMLETYMRFQISSKQHSLIFFNIVIY